MKAHGKKVRNVGPLLRDAAGNLAISADATFTIAAYGSAGSFPNKARRNSNYWVDVVSQPDAR